MYSGLQPARNRLASNESLQNVYFLCGTALDAPGIMKNISRVVREHKFIVDLVLATLAQNQGGDNRQHLLSRTSMDGRSLTCVVYDENGTGVMRLALAA